MTEKWCMRNRKSRRNELQQLFAYIITRRNSHQVSEIQELQEALKYLSEEEMELIRLLFFEEYTVKKTAQYFGCCTKTIRNRKNKVLQKLKDRLETL